MIRTKIARDSNPFELTGFVTMDELRHRLARVEPPIASHSEIEEILKRLDATGTETLTFGSEDWTSWEAFKVYWTATTRFAKKDKKV